MSSKKFFKVHRCLKQLSHLERRIKLRAKTIAQRSNLGEFVYVVAGALSNSDEYRQWCVQAVRKTMQEVWVQCPVSSLHRTSVSRKDTFLTLIATTSFPPCPTEGHEVIFEDTQASRMAAVWLIIAWRKMVNKGHGMAHVDWVEVKKVWKRSMNLLPWCCVNSQHFIVLLTYILKIFFLLWTKVSLQVVFNKSHTITTY